MYTELRQSLPMSTPKGDGYAVAVIDYGQEHDLLWVVVIHEDGKIWTVPNPEVRVTPNYSMRAKRSLKKVDEFYLHGSRVTCPIEGCDGRHGRSHGD